MISELSIPAKTTHDKKDKLSCLIEMKLFFVSVHIKLEFLLLCFPVLFPCLFFQSNVAVIASK